MNARGLLRILFAGELRRSGQLVGLLVALTAGCALLWAVAVVSARIDNGLNLHTAALFGGDFRVSAPRPLDEWFDSLPPELKPQGQIISLPTMARYGQAMRLVRLKGVDDGYPLLGELRIEGQGAQGSPPPGQVWVGPALVRQLGAGVGESILIGQSEFSIAGIIEREPDSVASGFSLGPRVILGMVDLAGTGLVGFGSRISYRASFLDPDETRLAILSERVPPWARLTTAAEEMNQTRELLRKSGHFMMVLVISALLLCGVTAVLAVQGLLVGRLRDLALLGLLGVTRGSVLRLFVALFLTLGIAAVVMGGLLGELLQRGIVAMMGEPLAAAGFKPRLVSLAVMLGLLMVAALPPLLAVTAIPPKRLLTGQVSLWLSGRRAWLIIGLLLAGLGLILLLADALRLPLLLAVSGGLAIVLLARLQVWLLGRLPAPLEPRLALLGLSRSPARSSIALSGLTLAVVALMLPLLLRGDFIDQLAGQLPVDGPDRYLIDIQPDQHRGVSEVLGAALGSPPPLHPVYRARLTRVDGIGAKRLAAREGRAHLYAQRENNLSELLPGGEAEAGELIAGRWWGANPPAGPEVSVEEGWADALGVDLGSELEFNVAGQSFRARVSSLRRVNWSSMEINFFLLFSPGALTGLPHTFITAYNGGSAEVPAFEETLIRQFPNISVIDVAQLVGGLRELVDQLARALLALAVALPVIGAALLWTLLLTDRQQLVREALLLRLLGAADGQLRRIYLWRYGLLGALAALLGGGVAIAGAYYLSQSLFEMAYRPGPGLLLGFLVGAVALTLASGYGTARMILDSPPARLLRQRPS
ncbi:MAG: hypothetical protein J4A00_02950 [Gammaproteobacteria bacterium]|nr:hypothetical protein [Gammaproteobacteria bacterium]